MSSVVISGDTSGAVTLTVPAVAGTNTITVPANTGTMVTTASSAVVSQAMMGTNVGGTAPAFSANKLAATQSVSATTWTKVVLEAEDFDTNNNFASNRFTATIAGYYTFSANAESATVGAGNYMVGMFYKNGAYYTRIGNAIGTLVSPIINGSVVAYLGVGDYMEFYVYCGIANTLDNSNYGCRFSGAMIRGA